MCRRNRSPAPYFQRRVLASANHGRRQAGKQLSQFLSDQRRRGYRAGHIVQTSAHTSSHVCDAVFPCLQSLVAAMRVDGAGSMHPA